MGHWNPGLWLIETGKVPFQKRTPCSDPLLQIRYVLFFPRPLYNKYIKVGFQTSFNCVIWLYYASTNCQKWSLIQKKYSQIFSWFVKTLYPFCFKNVSLPILQNVSCLCGIKIMFQWFKTVIGNISEKKRKII